MWTVRRCTVSSRQGMGDSQVFHSHLHHHHHHQVHHHHYHHHQVDYHHHHQVDHHQHNHPGEEEVAMVAVAAAAAAVGTVAAEGMVSRAAVVRMLSPTGVLRGSGRVMLRVAPQSAAVAEAVLPRAIATQVAVQVQVVEGLAVLRQVVEGLVQVVVAVGVPTVAMVSQATALTNR